MRKKHILKIDLSNIKSADQLKILESVRSSLILIKKKNKDVDVSVRKRPKNQPV